ncbi:hypothetical protein [Arcobacter sp. FWKO B]|uniref:hypothetical protein n=1 Tax=Arcobacter sp. FWKO B TaxID=2593672 RepID=UPI0018A62104|nr:hypothetical protein [Arcobacter sp. FWKO B]QOG12853.1 hypothetical protein FWKOB_09175 [Arcobacter sp. FWKO B]
MSVNLILNKTLTPSLIGGTIAKLQGEDFKTGAGVATGISAHSNYDKYDGAEYATHVATDGTISYLVGKYIPAGQNIASSLGYGALGGGLGGGLSEFSHQYLDTKVFGNQENMDKSKIFLNSTIEGTAGALGKFYKNMGEMMEFKPVINYGMDIGASQSFKPIMESQRNSFDSKTKQETE